MSADLQKAVTGSDDGKLYQGYAAYQEAMKLVRELHEAVESLRLLKVTGNSPVRKPVAYDMLLKGGGDDKKRINLGF